MMMINIIIIIIIIHYNSEKDQFADEPCMQDAEQKIWFDGEGLPTFLLVYVYCYHYFY